jgi:NAD(P)-dependent dehydrogenase (short-subunit alcohol dehydrogenase family)/acyl carrier protein
MPAAIAGPASGERVGEVMTHYQRVMQQFLETERTVMVSYLNGARGLSSGVVSPASAPPVSAVAAPALPPPVAAPPPALPPAVETPPAPPPAAETALTPATEAPGDSLTPEQIQERLVAVVSERTGYPAEMLALDADLEGDLGIDSIKRVEIAGTFSQSLSEEARAAIDMEQLTASRTLAEVIATLQAALAPAEGQPTRQAALAPAEVQPSFEPEPAEKERIGRFVLQASSAPEITAKGELAPAGAVIIVDDGSGAGERLARMLTAEGEDVLVLPAGSGPSDAEDASALAVQLGEEHAGVKALIHLAAPDEEYGGLARLFLLAQALREPLEAAAGAGGAALLGVTRLGGAFGVDGDTDGHVAQGAIPGFLKALSLEWPAVRVKAIDLPAGCERAADYLRAELFAADGVVEVGYRDDERTQLTLVPAPLERDDGEPLSSESVVLLTGGARGITAEVAMSLAARHRPTLLLVGRTPLTDEPPETASLAEVADLRGALIEARKQSGQKLTPALVEEDCRRILREREVRHNLTRLRDGGARVEYLRCDVADAAAFEALIDQVYERYGRIDCVVHGAGLIEDRLIRDKRLDSLERVLETKAGAALTLSRKLRPDSLRALVLFGSVAGRFGNRGQADYGAASEVLAKLAGVLDRRWPARVVSIEWGPWRSTGMVSPVLEQEFERRGVALIDVARGCEAFERELRAGGAAEATVVISASSGLAGAGNARRPLLGSHVRIVPVAAGGVEAARSLELTHDRYLDDHRVDGQAVLPFAVAMELMAELATAARPGQAFAGLRKIRLLKGISVPDDGSTPIRLTATPTGTKDELEVTVGAPHTDRLHYRATVQLGAAEDSRPPSPLTELTEFPMTLADAYRDLLFHGPIFQVIESIDGLDGRGATARLRPSDAGRCVAGADGLRWLLDPVMLDGALQVQVLWARLQWDVTLLPAEIGSYAHLADPRTGERVRHELRIRPESGAPMCHADHWFFGDDGRPLATLGDVVGVGTRALNRLAVASA